MDKDVVFAIVTRLSEWLVSLQIDIESPVLRERGGGYELAFRHPLKGQVVCPVPLEENIVRLEGIAFEISRDEGGVPVNVRCFDHGGIYDPVDGCVPGDHYSASHFALLNAVLYVQEPDPVRLVHIEKALTFQENKTPNYKASEWDPHWEFDNFAWALINVLLKTREDPNLFGRIRGFLLGAPQHRKPFATNWKILALIYLALTPVSTPLLRLATKLRSAVYAFLARRAFLPDGCIEDIPGKSRSIQYHAFSGALLGLLSFYTGDAGQRTDAVRAARYLAHFIDRSGAINYKGRGQNQVFGHVSAVYLFLFAGQNTTGAESEKFRSIAGRLLGALEVKQDVEGYFPLVLTHDGLSCTAGWHDYHHLTVYNAMAGAWLALALHHFPELIERGAERPELPLVSPIIHFRESGVVVGEKYAFFLCVSAGETYYETDCGFALHHFAYADRGSFVSCPGGPDKHLFGKMHRTDVMERNFCSPLVRLNGQWLTPAGKTGEIALHGSEILVRITPATGVHLLRTIQIKEKQVRFLDEVRNERAESLEVIGINLPLITRENTKWDLVAGGLDHCGGVTRSRISTWLDGGSVSIEEIETGVTAAGRITVFQSNPVVLAPGRRLNARIEWQLSDNE